jgi:methyl coenzyme M reductase gamma subunit
MDIEKIANDSGMQVVLDGRIGREEYKSVYGSLQALQRFANRIRELVASEAGLQTLHTETS